MLQTFVAQVSRIDDLTHDVRVIGLELRDPPEIHFQAGQFVSFSVPKPGLKHPITRPYSIASPPSSTHIIELLYNLVPGGPGSTYLHSLRWETRLRSAARLARSCCASIPIGASSSSRPERGSRRSARWSTRDCQARRR